MTESSTPTTVQTPLEFDSQRGTAQEHSLVVVSGDDRGKVFPLGQSTRIGKSPNNDVVIDHPTVSRAHLVMTRSGDRFTVRDLESTNGTFIDGAQIQVGYLKPGSVLKLGEVQLRFQPVLKAFEVSPLQDDKLGDMVGTSVAMRQVFGLIERVAPTDSTLLLIGETGCGKGAAAKAVHQLSPRSNGPFVTFDCAAVSSNLIESELFGHEKGAFTGAVAQRIGCLERSSGGTLFLDEIDDLPLDLQPKLLRALEDREFRRLGQSNGAHAFETRIVAASKKNLWAEALAGRFREDLYFRLSVFTVNLPNLRERKEDIPMLVDSISKLQMWSQLSEELREQFLAHTWPGNVRELRNAIERLKYAGDALGLRSDVLLRETSGKSETNMLPAQYLGPFKQSKEELVRAFEREYLTRILGRAEGNVTRAAREAEVDRKYFYSLLHKYGFVSETTK